MSLNQSLITRDKSVLTDKRYCAYQPFGSALDVLYDRSPEILMCGPAGTGKSRAILEKIHLCCSKYPGMRALMVRKTRESLTQSAMVTYEKFVIPDNNTVKFRTSEQEYRYSNGSKFVVGGMDKATKVLSSEYDIIYVMEATELSEDDWEHLITRNRFGVMPYNQLIADCNPENPRHWIKLRSDEGVIHYIPSVHEDNPTLFDHKKEEWTKRGADYIAKLNSLTGVRRKRLFLGQWAAAEGMIYEDEWDYNKNVINRFPIPRSWRRIWSIDFGFTNPFVWQAWALDEDDRAYRFAEIYQTRLLVEDAAAMIKRWQRLTAEPFPEAIVCDWDAEGRATLERHLGVDTISADKSILDGIEAVKSMMKCDDHDDKPRMYFLRDSLLEVDYELKDSGKPFCTEQEIDGYEWDDKKTKELPKKEDDHGCDAKRYMAMYVAGETGGWVRGMGS